MVHPVSHTGNAPEVAPEGATLRSLSRSVLGVLGAFGQSMGRIFFIESPWLGLLLWGALMSRPALALFGLCGLLSGVLIEWALRIRSRPELGGGVKANALLSAVVAGWMIGPMAIPWVQQLLLATAAAMTAALVTAALMQAFARSMFPVLLWGYCLVASLLFSICPDCTRLAAGAMPAWPMPTDAPGWLASFLRSMASLLYSPHVGAGVLVCLAVLLWSRAMFLAGVAGWLGGALLSMGFLRSGLFFDWLPLSYNYFIAGAALGAVIFVPGRLSLPVAAVAGALAAFLALALQYLLAWSAIAYLPVSSALVIWIGMGALTVAGEHAIVDENVRREHPPEMVWWDMAYWRARYGRVLPLLAVPMVGELQVSQGFKGRISHTGMYRHALDFQQRTDAGEPAASVWGRVVTAPAPGTVERTRDGVVDNPLGVCNYAENWGNYVVIRLDVGGWAMLAHLQQGSVMVAPGARVETGSPLGRVGSSGRSPTPHLHLQLQSEAQPGSMTRAFRLANYFTAEAPAAALTHWHASSVPDEGDVLMAALPNAPVHNTLAGMAPGTAVWTCEVRGDIPSAFNPGQTKVQQLAVHTDSFGQQVLDAGDQGQLVFALDPDALRVKALEQAQTPLLGLLAMAMASIPYATRQGTTWSDVAPTTPGQGWRRLGALLVAPYRPHPFPGVDYQCVSEPGVSGSLLEIVGTVVAPGEALPHRLVCQWAPLRGPVDLRVEFAAGELHFRLLSFEPAHVA